MAGVISLDTETTGLDLWHGARPFLVTIATEAGENYWWEWSVNPMTRMVKAKRRDLLTIRRMITRADTLVLQNPKFDYMGLSLLFADYDMSFPWDWGKVRDTLLAGHLLASNQPHDLTSMVLIYCGVNLQPYEDAIRKSVMECRRLCQGKKPRYKWRIADKGLPEMPSATSEPWKYDMWLPRYVASKVRKLGKNHRYWTDCSEYANSDSTSTLALYNKMEQLIVERGLQRIYSERLKLLPIIVEMERQGVTIDGTRLRKTIGQYRLEAKKAEKQCVDIAAARGCKLNLPKSGNNQSLLQFCFGEAGLQLEPYETSKRTGKPSLNARCVEHYRATLDGTAKKFLDSLTAKRKRDTAVNYMAGYRRFWLPTTHRGWYVLHPSLNPTGTFTLRWSSSNPNEQNISKKELNLRQVFGPAPGREWWSLDAKNIEMRIPAYESGQGELIDLFEYPNEPPYYGSTHLLNFHTVYPDIWDKELREVGFDKVGPHCKKKYASTWYQWCKNGGFAVQYGAIERENGTADKAFHREGSHAKLKHRFNKLSAHNQRCIDFARRHGYIETIPDKTVDPVRGYPLMCTTQNKWGKSGISPTIPLNYRTQSTAMWWMMKAMIRCQEYLDSLDGYYMIIQIHDELVFDFPRGKTPKANYPKIRKIQKLMELGGEDIGIPTPVSVEYHPHTWAEGITI